MKLVGSIALVTGANGGLGLEIVNALVNAGTKKVYAAHIDKDVTKLKNIGSKVKLIQLDVTDDRQINDAVGLCSDVNLLINNAGVNYKTGLISAKNLNNARHELEVNYFGPLKMCRAFTPIIESNDGGMIVNIISSLAYVSIPEMGSLCASKAANRLLTQGVRAEVKSRGVHVMGVFPGSVKTEMVPLGMTMPDDVAKRIIEAINKNVEDLYPTKDATQMMLKLKSDPKAVELEYAKRLPK